MINKDRLKLALDALRSGEYQQGRGALCTVDEDGNRNYCCLGVLTDVAIKNGLEMVETEEKWRNGDIIGFVYTPDRGTDRHYVETNVLHPAVQDWYGISGEFDQVGYRNNPLMKHPALDHPSGNTPAAAELNDGLGWDFEHIAQAFEYTFLEEGEY